MKNQDQPISPCRISGGSKQFSDWTAMGLTKREYFAGLAMQGLMSKDYVKLDITEIGSTYTNVEMIADMSIKIADELLKQLEQ